MTDLSHCVVLGDAELHTYAQKANEIKVGFFDNWLIRLARDAQRVCIQSHSRLMD
jgi:hypothetical protein